MAQFVTMSAKPLLWQDVNFQNVPLGGATIERHLGKIICIEYFIAVWYA